MIALLSEITQVCESDLIEGIANAQTLLSVNGDCDRHIKIGVAINVQKIIAAATDDHWGS